MTRARACTFLLVVAFAAQSYAQDAAPSPRNRPRDNPAEKAAENRSETAAEKPAEKDPLKQALGGGFISNSKEPVTTEILADEAFFDSGNSIGIFSGHVIVKDPRFNLQADKLTVYLGKGETRGLDRAVAEGNVGMIREAPGENGGAPMRSVGRAESAVYTAGTGNVELKGTPRVQSGVNSHIATSPDTVMVINQSGQLTTKGPSRTEIRQDPKPAPKP